MLTQQQVAVLLSYATIIGGRHFPMTDHDIQSSFVSRGGKTYYEVCLVEDYLGYSNSWEARGTGETLDEAVERCVERASNHYRYEEWADMVHSMNAFVDTHVSVDEVEPDIFVPKKMPSNSSRCYFFEDARYFSGASKKHHKRYHNRYIRRESSRQIREVV